MITFGVFADMANVSPTKKKWLGGPMAYMLRLRDAIKKKLRVYLDVDIDDGLV